MGEGELELCLPSPIFGRGAGGEGKDLSKIGMLPISPLDKGGLRGVIRLVCTPSGEGIKARFLTAL